MAEQYLNSTSEVGTRFRRLAGALFFQLLIARNARGLVRVRACAVCRAVPCDAVPCDAVLLCVRCDAVCAMRCCALPLEGGVGEGETGVVGS